MQKAFKVTLFVVPVLAVVSFFATNAFAQSSAKPNKVVISADRRVVEAIPEPDLKFSVDMSISRSASLYDHKDGTNQQGMDYLINPKVITSVGTFKALLTYSQDLKDQSDSASSFGDILLSYSLVPNKWRWSPPYIITLTPYISTILPASQTSVKRDQLQTSVSGGLSFGIVPNGVAPAKDGAWSLALGLSAGQNVHAYDTNINGDVLNHYLSNQSINVGYTYKNFVVSVEYINKIRWTYQGNQRGAYEHTEEIGYGINDHLSIAAGHTTAGSAVRSNGVDSNLSVVSDNDSKVYVSMGLAF